MFDSPPGIRWISQWKNMEKQKLGDSSSISPKSVNTPVVQITIAKMHVVEIVIHRLPEFKRLSQLPWELLSIA